MTLFLRLLTAILLSVLAAIPLALLIDILIIEGRAGDKIYYITLFSIVILMIIGSYRNLINENSAWYFPLKNRQEILIFISMFMISTILFSLSRIEIIN